MNVLVVSGIWPPDVGGPASHAPEVCAYLLERGHRVEAVTMADRAPEPRPYPVHWTSRRLPRGVRHVVVAWWIARLAGHADVVYSTGMLGRTSLGTALARTPVILKLTSDPAFERAVRWGLAPPDLAAFQRVPGLRAGLLRRLRDRSLARASRVIAPSDWLRRIAVGWGVPAEKAVVLPNPVAPSPELGTRDELRRIHGLVGPTLVFAGRLVPQKSLEVALEAVRQVPDVSLVIVGGGEEGDRLEREARALGVAGRVTFVGPQPRRAVLELLSAADAALLPSSWENFPHMAVEALSVGTPVLATPVGGVPEIVRDEHNGLLVPSGDADALARAIRRYFEDRGLQDRLRANAVESIAPFAPETIYARLEALLAEAAGKR